MNARTYYLKLQTTIHAAPHVLHSRIEFDEIDTNECYIRGVLALVGNLELHIAEYIVTVPTIQRLKYRYHLQTSEGALVSRWDNVPHHPQVSTFPYHRHDSSGNVHTSPPMDIPSVLTTILRLTH